MRILHVIGGLSPAFGGPTAALYGMARATLAAGHEVDIVTSDHLVPANARPSEAPATLEDGVPVRRFRSPRFAKYGYSPDLARWLRANARRYDVLHLHGILAHSTLVGAHAARREGRPYVVRPAGEMGGAALARRRVLKRLAFKLRLARELERAAFVHATSPVEARDVRAIAPRARVEIVPHGVTWTAEAMRAQRGEFLAEHPDLAGRRTVVFLGRLDPIKGLDLLLDAFAGLRAGRAGLRLVLAGEGTPEHMASLRGEVAARGLEKDVVFTGFLDGRAKRALLLDATVFALPSYGENFGVAAAEALDAGTPVVLSQEVGIASEVAQAQAGLVVPCEARALEAALGRVLDDPELRDRLSRSGRDLAHRVFSWDSVAPGLVELYRSAIPRQV